MIELRVIWHPNFIDTRLNIDSNSVKPWFLDEEYVCIVTARVEERVSDGVRFVDVLRQESNVEIG